jgi:hypothetical protein
MHVPRGKVCKRFKMLASTSGLFIAPEISFGICAGSRKRSEAICSK